MKKLLAIITLMVFVITVPMVMAQGTGAGDQKPVEKPAAKTSINCCVKGQLKQVGTEADCLKEQGKVVKDAKDCK